MSPRRIYAICWREPDGALYVGKLELRLALIRLEGRGPDRREVGRSIPYSHVEEVTASRSQGHRGLRVDVRDTGELELTSLDGPGALTELEHELRGRTEKPYGGSGIAPMPAGA